MFGNYRNSSYIYITKVLRKRGFNMQRIGAAFFSVMWILFMSSISYGFVDRTTTFETWVCAFGLPMWTIFSIGVWYDTGKTLFSTERNKRWIHSIPFVLWMSTFFTLLIWTYIRFQALPLLVVVPFLAIPLRRWLAMDWSDENDTGRKPTLTETIATICWAVSSYLVYWVLTFAWIVFKISLLYFTEDVVIYYMT